MWRMTATRWVLVLGLLVQVRGDVYMHNMRGSNNRLNEATRDRANANRLFDSQNNERGGSNVGSQPMYYFVGSKLRIEWANQHSCNNPNSNCEIILQYMCGPTLRDGTVTTQIPAEVNSPLCAGLPPNCATDPQFGLHETHDYYALCANRDRNKGLFTSDRALAGNAAIYTRQNNAGNRNGLECPEERDYYPYWHPSPWKDIAVLTNNISRCDYYKAESQNVKSRWSCVVPVALPPIPIPNNQASCNALSIQLNNPLIKWTVTPSFGIPAPECLHTGFSRDNHLGNTYGGYFLNYNWTVPDDANANCALRLRYNISTGEFEGWNVSVNANHNANPAVPGTQVNLPVEFYNKYGFTTIPAATARGYNFKNNPTVQLFPNVPTFALQLTMNTNQYGRTFQDRSHRFSIRSRTFDLVNVNITNINVRGKRGNIVQTYPGVEYDFVPEVAQLYYGDYVHFQWTGSDTNPANNAGQGAAGTDRSNVLLLGPWLYSEGQHAQLNELFFGHSERTYPPSAYSTSANFLGFSPSDLISLALLANPGLGDADLNNAQLAYFDLAPRRMTGLGQFNYVCTRNNAFSNRGHKGRIQCDGWTGGNYVFGLVSVTVNPNVVYQETDVTISVQNSTAGNPPPPGRVIGSYLNIALSRQLIPGKSLIVQLQSEATSTDDLVVYQYVANSWIPVLVNYWQGPAVQFTTSAAGLYIVVAQTPTTMPQPGCGSVRVGTIALNNQLDLFVNCNCTTSLSARKNLPITTTTTATTLATRIASGFLCITLNYSTTFYRQLSAQLAIIANNSIQENFMLHRTTDGISWSMDSSGQVSNNVMTWNTNTAGIYVVLASPIPPPTPTPPTSKGWIAAVVICVVVAAVIAVVVGIFLGRRYGLCRSLAGKL